MLVWVAFGKLPVVVNSNLRLLQRQIVEENKYIQGCDPNACSLVVKVNTITSSWALGKQYLWHREIPGNVHRP